MPTLEEKIDPQMKQDLEEEITESEELIESPYNPDKIKVDSQPMTIFQVMRKINLNEINLQPEFQRHIVWSQIKQSRLIESILIRIPLPAFYLDAVDVDDWLIVDGLQRLWTLDSFYNQKKLRLEGLEFLTNLNGKSFEELPRSYQRQIEETNLLLYIIKPDTPPEAKFTIFYRINTGGVVLSAQEIRHCLFHGKSTVLLAKLASLREFRQATTDSIPINRMADRECILRYCAFHLKPFTEYKAPDLDNFLCDSMRSINKMTEEEINELETNFRNSMALNFLVFGRDAFRKPSVNNQRFPINKSLFEVWSVALEKFETTELIANKVNIVKLFNIKMSIDNEYLTSFTQGTGGVRRVQKRFGDTIALIEEALS